LGSDRRLAATAKHQANQGDPRNGANERRLPETLRLVSGSAKLFTDVVQLAVHESFSLAGTSIAVTWPRLKIVNETSMERAKIHPVVIGAAAAVLVSSALGAAAITGALPISSSRPEVAAAPATCAHCGVVESVRTAVDRLAKDVKTSTLYRVTVRMDDGSTRSLWLPSAPGYAVGDRVRVLSGPRLERLERV